ncbi:MAG: glycosyltransferase family 9 protein [Vicinamibacterales bacterium]
MKILLIRLRQIGDVVFTTPAVHALRRQFPHAHLSYLVEPAAAPVVAHNPHLSQVIVAPRRSGLIGTLADLSLGRRLRRNDFDLVIDFHGGPRASLLAWLSGAPRRIGYDIPGRGWMYTDVVARPRELRPRHSVENQWDLLAPLGIGAPTPEGFPVEMLTGGDAEERVTRRLKAAGIAGQLIIVMHVSAGNPFRRWPVASFGEVAARLLADQSHRRIIVTSGPSEADAAARVVNDARLRLPALQQSHVEAWSDDFPLEDLRALSARAALYIGGDSGPMHVAATSDVPMVSLYGPTLPARSAPWRSHPERAVAVGVQDLACRPCDQRVCVTHDFRCLGRLEPAAVLAAAEFLLANERVH